MLIVPCALAFRLFGKSEVLPGLIAILTWGSLFTFVLARICRRVDAPSFLLGVGVMCVAFVASFSFHFEQWYAFLGEIVAATLIIVAHWILANERFSRNWLFLAGLLLGLAFQAKILAAVSVTGIGLLFVIRGIQAGCSPAQWLRYALILVMGFVIPTLAFEGYKLLQLGHHAYVVNWRELLAATRERGAPGTTHVTWSSLQQRMALVYERFGFNLFGLLGINVMGALLNWRSASKNWALFSGGILLSMTSAAIYWATLSPGWARYLVICIAMGVFLLSIPIFTVTWWRKLLFVLFAILLLKTGFDRSGHIFRSADRGLFRPSEERTARASLVQIIERRQAEGPVILASRWWGSLAAVEFLLPGSMNFERIETALDRPGPKLILFNHRFDPPSDEVINTARTRTSQIIFTGGPYELVEVR
jgi:hypothetical protein